MRVEYSGYSNRFEVTDNMCHLFPEESYVQMERFTFNMRSLSFVLVERPTKYGLDHEHRFIRIMKVRCDYPKVEFLGFGICMPQITYLGLHETIDYALVELENYARITCSKVSVKTERIDMDDPDTPHESIM